MNGYTPDATVAINTSHGPAVVHLAMGGDQFPWAVFDGRVYVGLFDGELDCGTRAEALEWNVNDYWVVDAYDQDGNSIELNPAEYKEAVTRVGVRKTPLAEDNFPRAL